MERWTFPRFSGPKIWICGRPRECLRVIAVAALHVPSPSRNYAQHVCPLTVLRIQKDLSLQPGPQPFAYIMTMWLFRTVIKQAFIALCVICCTTSLQEGESMRQGHIRVLSFLACVSCAFCITCYECTSSQGQECKYTATSCQYGFFGCVKIAAFSGGVDKMGMWYDQDRRIITMIRGCAILPFGGVDMCEQTSILGVRVLKCTCFNDYCNSSRTFSTYGVVIGVFLVFLISMELF
ncbi:hypothetical protein Y032_0023g820 [Ancylostoma ceylanicum]|uniref:Protein sleepless n=2 Tax=Ancylostoma ceylanicum TaxID=53326 RepID=A0A016UZW4_9BILA|nr:hypothetical protein Y032_0023g820 [Ancylostoma ceylanicum]